MVYLVFSSSFLAPSSVYQLAPVHRFSFQPRAWFVFVAYLPTRARPITPSSVTVYPAKNLDNHSIQKKEE